MKTLKGTPEEELQFIGKVVKKLFEVEESSWDMTVSGAEKLEIASHRSPGMALYMLDVIDPQPESIITDDDIVRHFPLGFQGDWETTWSEFEKQDQRRVFKH